MINTNNALQRLEAPEPVFMPGETSPETARTIGELRSQSKERFAGFVEIGTAAVEQQAEEERATEERRKAEASRLRTEPKVENVPSSLPMVMELRPAAVRMEQQNESLAKGAVAAGLGAGAALGVLPAYASSLLMQAKVASLGFWPSAAQAAVLLGIPAATGTAGYYLGKNAGHPTTGAIAGTAAGAAGVLSWMPYANITMHGAGVAGASYYGSVMSAFSAGGLALSAGIMAGVGAALYGLGRWHGKVWGSKPRGILGNMARGLISPISIPAGYASKLLKKS